MADQQYDISPEMQELFRKKQEKRAAAKDYWRKQMYNPYVQNRPFDPVLFRYTALSAYSVEHYRRSPKHTFISLLSLSPFFITGYVVYIFRKKREDKWRSGVMKYEDRRNKLIY